MQATSVRQNNADAIENEGMTDAPITLLHRLFSARAALAPASCALIHGQRQLSYGELDGLSNALAHRLVASGLQPDDRVAFLANRSVESIIALLAILKAGGACVPLDPAYPRERLAYMLSHSQAHTFFHRGEDLHDLATTHPRALNLHGWEETCALPPAPVLTPEHLAYVLYTSGSTGRPKAVAMPHRALVNLIEWHVETYPVTTARTLQFSSPSFDVSFQEIFTAWHAGGAVVMISDLVRRDPFALLQHLIRHEVEALFCPVVALHTLAETAVEPLPTSLRHVFAAGEQLKITSAVRSFFQHLPECSLHNHYGPAETHVITAHTLSGPPSTWPALPPIGQPITNVTLHLLPQNSLGLYEEVGEISAGGVCVARGYLDAPELTAGRFVADPAFPGMTFYRTGDLAQPLPEGDLQFLGRVDDQVKVSGYRIEPGEIENLLEQHPAIRQAAVTAADNRLFAFIVPVESATLDEQELRAFASQQLPPYMVPARYYPVASLPLTPSGKVDRRALAPGVATPPAPAAPTPVGGETTLAIVTACWCELLQLPTVDPTQNFFDLGGTSLLITQLQQRLSQRLERSVEVTQLFEHPTIESFTAALDASPTAALAGVASRAARQQQARARATTLRNL
ncbi:MAG: non-ribosomal peptide synthetase [Chthoniobacteraceae bacterium]